MNNDYILKADVLDIIFEKKNKSYGAYALRKFYNNRLYKALALTFGLAAMVVFCLSFFSKRKATIEVPDVVTISGYIPKVADKAPEKPKQPEQQKAKPAEAAPKPNTQQWVKNIVVTKEPVVAKLPKNLDSLIIGSITENHPGGGGKQLVNVPAGPGDGGGGDGGGGTVEIIKINKEIPLDVAEVMPAYPGGMAALRKFLERNLQNPQDLDEGQTVSVKVKFIVGYDGNLKSFETVEDGGKVFNNEVVRVLKKMPQWIPGKSKGENVSVFYTIPVKFTASE